MIVICVALASCSDKKKTEGEPAKPVETQTPTPTPTPTPEPTAKPTQLSSQGVGPLTDLMQGTRSDEDQAKLITDAVAPLGLTVEMAVMDLPGEVETEEGYFSVRRGNTEVLQIFRGDEAAPKMTVHVVDPMFGTADGIEVGDTAGDLAAKRKDVACTVDAKNPLGLITCRSAADGGLTFVFDAQGYRGTRFDLAANADRKIIEIVL
jgi:hypothetical protein